MTTQFAAAIRTRAKLLMRPHDKFAFLNRLPRNAQILDVGCGNNSPNFVKSILPGCRYTGVDIGDYNQTLPNLADEYLLTTPEKFPELLNGLRSRFDAVISAHNIEHCDNRSDTFTATIDAVKPGGFLYLAFPSSATVTFPSRRGCLNYFDDPTHKGTPPDFDKIVGTIEARDFAIEYSAKNYQPAVDWIRGWLNEPRSRRQNALMAGTWAYYGFESIVWARRRINN
jgi:SAM-dependent methyltransferase